MDETTYPTVADQVAALRTENAQLREALTETHRALLYMLEFVRMGNTVKMNKFADKFELQFAAARQARALLAGEPPAAGPGGKEPG